MDATPRKPPTPEPKRPQPWVLKPETPEVEGKKKTPEEPPIEEPGYGHGV